MRAIRWLLLSAALACGAEETPAPEPPPVYVEPAGAHA